MDIQQHDDGKKGRFFVQVDQQDVAEMTYVWLADEKIIIDNTAVDASLNGQGVGRQMVERAVGFAREKGIKIIPLCPFAKSVFDKTEAFHDVL